MDKTIIGLVFIVLFLTAGLLYFIIIEAVRVGTARGMKEYYDNVGKKDANNIEN